MTRLQQAATTEVDEGQGGTNEVPPDLSAAPAMGRARRALGAGLGADVAAMAALVGILALLWGRGAGTWFWLDEGIAVGISSHPFGSIPELLARDGSPPLYYALLHVWMSIFGSSESATHALSLLFALATVPTALWAGWSLFGRRAGWMSALLAAVNPFIAYHANETRMYALVALLTFVVVATFVHGFVFRRRRHLVGFAAALTLLLYTHNWGLLVAVGCAAAILACLVLGTDRESTARDAALAFAAVGVAYLPWLPTLLEQLSAQLQPWAQKPTLLLIRDQVATAVGGSDAVVALGLGAGVGLVAMLRWPWDRQAIALATLAIPPVVVLAGGWITSVFAYRYLAALVAPIVLLAGVGLARGGRTALAALGVVAFLTAPIAVKTPPYQKSNARSFAEEVSAVLRPGDVVISPDLQLPPLLSRYLPPGLRYFTAAGPVADHNVVDWRSSLEQLRRGDPSSSLSPVLEQLSPGAHVLFACPPAGARDIADLRQQAGTPQDVTERGVGLGAAPATAATRAAWGDSSSEKEPSALPTPAAEGVSVFHSLIVERCRQTAELLLDHPQLRLETTLEAPPGITWTPVDGLLLTRTT